MAAATCQTMWKVVGSFAAALWVAALVTRPATAGAVERPNILFLFSDDQRADTIGTLGNPHIQTPHLDRLADNGFVFHDVYCQGSTSAAVCAPSRAMLITGRTLFHIPTRVAVPWTVDEAEQGRSPYVTLPETLRQAGYATFGTGKWHNGERLFAKGFTHGGNIFFGGMSKHTEVPIQDFDPTGVYDKSRARIGQKFSSELFADAAVDFLKTYRDDRPFFMFVAFTAPHDPRTPPGEYATMYDPASLPLPANYLPLHPFNNGDMTGRDEKTAPWPRTPEAVRQALAAYYGMISHMDAQIGRILDALAQSGRAGETIIVFSSDHGLAIGSHGLMGKQNLYEHSMGAPLVITGPGVPAQSGSHALCYLLDLFPTFCDLVGVPIPDSVEGESLVPVIRGERTQVRDSLFTAYRDVQRTVRTERWKLIRYTQINKTQLFDLASDPAELANLADSPEYAGHVKRMTALLGRWQGSLDDTQPLSTDHPQPEQIELPPPKRVKKKS